MAFVGRWLVYVLGAAGIATAFGTWGPPSELPGESDFETAESITVTIRTYPEDVVFHATHKVTAANHTDDSVYLHASELRLDVYDNGSEGTGLVCAGVRASGDSYIAGAPDVFGEPLTTADGLFISTVGSSRDEAYEKVYNPFDVYHKAAESETYSGNVGGPTCAGGVPTPANPQSTTFLTAIPGWNTYSGPQQDSWYWFYFDCDAIPCHAVESP